MSNVDIVSALTREELDLYLSETIQSLKPELSEELAAFNEEAQKARYIKDIQEQLTFLSNAISGFDRGSGETVIVLTSTAAWVLKKLFALLDYLKEYYNDYFNFQAILPDKYIIHLQEIYPVFQNIFNANMVVLSADPDLFSLLKRFSDSGSKSETFSIRTWEHWDYMMNAVQVFTDFNVSAPNGELAIEIIKLFICLDFNSIYVYAYFLKYIERITLTDKSFLQKQEDLLYLIKVFRQVRVDSSVRYRPLVQSLKTSVLESLQAELNYLEDKEKAMLQSFKGTTSDAPTKFYFKVMITLQELMFFFRVMLDVGFIQTKFNSYLYEFIANHIKTERAENISRKSLRNHFSNKPYPERIVVTIRSWLTKMVSHIDLYYKS